MAQVLVRDVPEQVHKNIAAAAAAANRSMQAELLATLQEKYAARQKRPLLDILLSASGDGDDIEILRDTPIRDFSFGDVK